LAAQKLFATTATPPRHLHHLDHARQLARRVIEDFTVAPNSGGRLSSATSMPGICDIDA
jgi:hypothetical protein